MDVRLDPATYAGLAGGDAHGIRIAGGGGGVVEDVKGIKADPLVLGAIPDYGYIYDRRSGRLLRDARGDCGRWGAVMGHAS